MMFKPFRSEDFLPSQVREGSEIGVVDSAKLLGLTITSNLPWDDETQLICKKSYVKIPHRNSSQVQVSLKVRAQIHYLSNTCFFF